MISTDEISMNVYITYFDAIKKDSQIQSKRIRQFADLILNLAYLNVDKLQVKVFTNLESPRLENALVPLQSNISTSRQGLIFLVPPEFLINVDGAYEPQLLTWAHKSEMEKDFSKGDDKSFYLYLEDDAIFSQANLEYFIRHREILKTTGLIPSFLRAEWSDKHGAWINSDAFERISETAPNDLAIEEDVIYREMKNPYCALTLFDQQLAEEYINSGSSNVATAKTKHSFIWDTAATAALGLIAEEVPVGRNARTVVAFSRNTNFPLIGSIVRHQGDRYANEIWWRHFRLFDNNNEVDLPRLKRNSIQYLLRLRSEWKVILVRFLRKMHYKVK
jgi:hypothetical protein